MTENNIDNWLDLINRISTRTETIYQKLLVKINHLIRPQKKADELFDPAVVKSNHKDLFTLYKLTYEQLQIEDDIEDIFADILSLEGSFETTINFNLVGPGKWIKLHIGNPARVFFFDQEKTILSDKSMAEFINKYNSIKSSYRFFGKEPAVYYKFSTLPPPDVVHFLHNQNITPLVFSDKTKKIIHDNTFSNRIIFDQSMLLTHCSNLSYGLSLSFYESDTIHSQGKTKEKILDNKRLLDEFLSDKIWMVSEYIYEQTKFKLDKMGGPAEKQRFLDMTKKLVVVPDACNPRFYYMKDIELMTISVAEKEWAIIVTSNQRMCNKIDSYYSEMQYKCFIAAQLVESKYE